MKLREAIEVALSGSDVEPELLEAAFGEIMDGEAEPVQIAALLVALRAKGESVDEIVATARALRARATTAQALASNTIDVCGTGGSGVDTFNISTTGAFVVAGAGVPVAKHGNRAASSRSGSFDVLEALGVAIEIPVEACGEILEEIGIATFFARTAHPAFRHVAPVRQALGVRTLMNCLGPLLNPAGVMHQIVGVYDDALVDPLARALSGLGAKRALVVHGSDGLDEITTTGPTRACFVAGGEPRSLTIEPKALGLGIAKPADLAGGSPEENAEITRGVLAGEEGPCRDIVVLNAGAAIWVAEAAADLAAGMEAARRSIDTGAAHAKLEALIASSRARVQEAPA
ncbi:MAG: anthranilate phosphoribosyltransferase [Myxococcota bacterium]|jgi:anthranilate phosphoribosyltransferase|nr:anthranilate phosphoribosyltransferase [Myxococcota bacterium]